jgi:hypothetical protein
VHGDRDMKLDACPDPPMVSMRASNVPERVAIRPLTASDCRMAWLASRLAMRAL